jgi:hypothetical protein
LLRKAAERTIGGLSRAIGKCLDKFAPRECAKAASLKMADQTFGDAPI